MNTDRQILEILHMRFHDGMTTQAIADSMGRTRNSVIGLLNRVKNDTDKADVTPHLNGTMEPKWWLKGLRKQEKT